MPDVRLVSDLDLAFVNRFVRRLGLQLCIVPAVLPIPGSYWGAPEAGLIGSDLYARTDTPVHSLLHEAGHFVCMSDHRRATLYVDAGGSDAQEEAVCYLQVLLADSVPAYGCDALFADMDAWRYSFRAGTAAAWFFTDATDAGRWLVERGILSGSASHAKPAQMLRAAPVLSFEGVEKCL